MYLKLALRNIIRSAKDYVIYFVTMVLIVMLMYSFLALGFSDDIISMSENMSMLTTGMTVFSVIVSLISSYIVSYAVQFMLRQRKKEFAIYELLPAFIFSTICIVVVSLLTPPPSKEILEDFEAVKLGK